ncbi:hypothetical protein [Oleidesulfovibrio sp.]|uniref:hypothetical protein n=1 Tax=Oleidesulfovibrio sp. TaxID=2909707 RepID=UPI003A8A9C95
MQTYLVGGAVRDMLLGRKPREYDYVFSGTLNDFLQQHPKARKAGTQFQIAILNGLEFAPLRGNTIHDDLLARDFTINAIALDEQGKIYAHPEALQDLVAGRLALAGPTALEQDPVRIYRAARMVSTIPDLHIATSLNEAIRRTAETFPLSSIAPERIGNEIHKLLNSSKPGNLLRTLQRAACLTHWFQEFETTLPDNTPLADLEKTADLMDLTAGYPMAVWMALCHDLGSGVHSGGPDSDQSRRRARELCAQKFATRIKATNKHILAAKITACYFNDGVQYMQLATDTRIRLLLRLSTANLLHPFFKVIHVASGTDFTPLALQQLKAILKVRLAPDEQGRGAESGKVLHMKRCAALDGL